MASIVKRPNGTKEIQFVDAEGKRRTLRLGTVTIKVAQEVKIRLEQLLACKISGTAHDADLARWLATVGKQLAERLANCGLIAHRATAILGDFLAAFIKRKSGHLKPTTVRNYRVTADHLIRYFGEDRPIGSITAGDAEDFADDLRKPNAKGVKRAEATVSKQIRRGREFFGYAVKKELVSKNPFSEVRVGVERNDARRSFVTREDFAAVLDQVTDPQTRLALAAGRFVGLRIPSEIVGLRWDHVDWEKKRILIHSPKTEAEATGGMRWVPIFADFAPYLEEAFDRAESGAIFVISQGRENHLSQLWRKRTIQAIKRAGLKAWPRLLHALRGSCESELVKQFPITTVAKWMGHSVKVASEHYVSVTDSDFQKAAAESAAERSKPQQNSQQSETDGKREEKTEVIVPSGLRHNQTAQDKSRQSQQVTLTGFEPVSQP